MSAVAAIYFVGKMKQIGLRLDLIKMHGRETRELIIKRLKSGDSVDEVQDFYNSMRTYELIYPKGPKKWDLMTKEERDLVFNELELLEKNYRDRKFLMEWAKRNGIN